MSNVIGIDIGARGALALLSPAGELLEIADMPVLRDGPANRPNVNAPLLASIIRRWQASQAFVEYVGARPKEGATGAFAFGRSKGVIEGVCASAGLPVAFLTPCAWKRAVGIPPGKENKDSARSVAISRWPSEAALFARKCDCDRAEAALIGLAGLLRGRKVAA